MTRKKWQEVEAAMEILGLTGRMTMAEIKNCYRRKSKESHPDLVGDSQCAQEQMLAINEAYKVIWSYCQSFRFPLTYNKEDLAEDDEDWWLNRFGQDPLWSKPKSK